MSVVQNVPLPSTFQRAVAPKALKKEPALFIDCLLQRPRRGNHLQFLKGRVFSVVIRHRADRPGQPTITAQRLTATATDAGGLECARHTLAGIDGDHRRKNRRIGQVPTRIGWGGAAVEHEILPGAMRPTGESIDLGHTFDHDGQWAASGRVLPRLLASMLHDPYFSRLPPKSTGRDLFNANWLHAHLTGPHHPPNAAPADVQTTLAELTAVSAASALRRHLPGVEKMLVCGGGALNGYLMRRLAALLPGVTVISSDAAGLPALQVEAAAFAWLAKASVDRRPGNCPAVTGASGLRILGALYPHADRP